MFLVCEKGTNMMKKKPTAVIVQRTFTSQFLNLLSESQQIKVESILLFLKQSKWAAIVKQVMMHNNVKRQST